MRSTAALLAGLALVAGCGGSDAPSRAEWARSADKICADVNRQVSKLGAGTLPGELDRTLTGVRRQLDDAVARLRRLRRPSGKDGELALRWTDRLAGDRDRFEPILAELQAARRARDRARIRSASRRLDRFDTKETDRLARRLGMKACAQ